MLSGSVVRPLELISAPILPIPTKMSHGARQVWGNMITTQMDGQNLDGILWDTLGSVTTRDFAVRSKSCEIDDIFRDIVHERKCHWWLILVCP